MTTTSEPLPVSYDEGLKLVQDYAGKVTGRHRAALLMQEGDEYFFWTRDGEPCYGFLRTYGANSTRPQDPKPSDLFNPFPDGTPVLLGVPFKSVIKYKGNEEFYDIWFGQASPYKDIFKDAEVIERGDEYVGIVFKDLDVDSTLLIDFLRKTRHVSSYAQSFAEFRSQFPDEDAGLLFTASFFIGSRGTPTFTLSNACNFHLGKWNKEITGGTFKNRYAYNRPDVDYVFGRALEDQNIAKIITKNTPITPGGYPKYDLQSSFKIIKEFLSAS